MIDEYKYQRKRKKRGDHCICSYKRPNGTWGEIHCPCGARTPPNKKHKTRMVKRRLKNLLRKEIQQH